MHGFHQPKRSLEISNINMEKGADTDQYKQLFAKVNPFLKPHD